MKQTSNILSPKPENEIIDLLKLKVGQDISIFGLHFLLNKFDVGKKDKQLEDLTKYGYKKCLLDLDGKIGYFLGTKKVYL